MRTYGRVGQTNGQGGTWVEVSTSADGDNSNVMLTALSQAIKLGLGESPFWASNGIPAQQSVITQVLPDYYATQTQTFWAPNFASLVITRVPQSSPPTYNMNVVCFNGAQLSLTIAT